MANQSTRVALLRLLLWDLKSRQEFRLGDGLLQDGSDLVLVQPQSGITRDDDHADRKIMQFLNEIVGQFAAAKIDIDDRDMRELLDEQPFGVRGACDWAGHVSPKRPQEALYGCGDVPGVLDHEDPQTRKVSGFSLWLLVVVCCCHPLYRSTTGASC